MNLKVQSKIAFRRFFLFHHTFSKKEKQKRIFRRHIFRYNLR